MKKMTTKEEKKKVVNEKIIAVRQDLSSSNTWSVKIDLSFTATKMYVLQCLYTATADTKVYSLYSSITNGYICLFANEALVPLTSINLKNFNNNTYTFRVDETLGTMATSAGTLLFLLKFTDE